jgi:COP9 signalosome complex subunit 3
MLKWLLIVSQGARTVGPMARAIFKMDPLGSTLTHHHLNLAKLANTYRSPSEITEVILSSPFFIAVKPGSTKPSPKPKCSFDQHPSEVITVSNGFSRPLNTVDILQYHYLCGVHLIALGEWRTALHALETVMGFPTKDGANSIFQEDAYKKWLLVNILEHGKYPPFPDIISPQPRKAMMTAGKDYEIFCTIWIKGDSERLRAEYLSNNAVWTTDGNASLVVRVLIAYRTWQIRALQASISELPLSHVDLITTNADVPANDPVPIKKVVEQMIARRQIDAHISYPGGVPCLKFNNRAQKEKGTIYQEAHRRILAQNQLLVAANLVNHRMAIDKNHVRLAQKQRKLSAAGAGMDIGMGGEEDEDLMLGTAL